MKLSSIPLFSMHGGGAPPPMHVALFDTFPAKIWEPKIEWIFGSVEVFYIHCQAGAAVHKSCFPDVLLPEKLRCNIELPVSDQFSSYVITIIIALFLIIICILVIAIILWLNHHHHDHCFQRGPQLTSDGVFAHELQYFLPNAFCVDQSRPVRC